MKIENNQHTSLRFTVIGIGRADNSAINFHGLCIESSPIAA